MASKSFSEKDFSCPVCSNIYKDPVLLTCTHSICNTCLQQFWETNGSRECPVCRRRCSKGIYPVNLALKMLCESFQEEKSPFCSLHRSDLLKFFCEDDKQLVCLVCRDSIHKNHNFSPINKAALERKEELKIKLKPLQKKLDNFKQVKTTSDETAQRISVQAQHTGRKIKEKFEKLHQFLQHKEAAKLAALREEEEQKSQMIKEKIEKMSREISSLSNTITAIEEEMVADDITFLQNYKSTVERAQCTLQDPEMVSGALINVAKHQDNLTFRDWDEMKEIVQHSVQYPSVTLDPKTAHPNLILSEDLTSVRYSSDRQQLPDNPERFDSWINVLGSEGFNSGTHCWDVEVGDNTNWDVGIMTEVAERKGQIDLWSGCWNVWYNQGEYRAISTPCIAGQDFPIKVEQKPQRIRVQLDWGNGMLSFTDPDNDTHLHTFTHTFTERVFPFFGTQCTRVPLKVIQ